MSTKRTHGGIDDGGFYGIWPTRKEQTEALYALYATGAIWFLLRSGLLARHQRLRDNHTDSA